MIKLIEFSRAIINYFELKVDGIDGEYRRNGEDCWEERIGCSWEDVTDTKDLEKWFRKWNERKIK